MTKDLKLDENWLWRCQVFDSAGNVIFVSKPFFALTDARTYMDRL